MYRQVSFWAHSSLHVDIDECRAEHIPPWLQISTSVVLSTFLTLPLMFVSAEMLMIKAGMHSMTFLNNTAFDVSLVTVVAGVSNHIPAVVDSFVFAWLIARCLKHCMI